MSELEQFKKWAASVDMPDAVLPRAWMAWQASADRAQPAQRIIELEDKQPQADLLAAAEEFCRKVEAGEARSTTSYAAFKLAIERIEKQPQAEPFGYVSQRTNGSWDFSPTPAGVYPDTAKSITAVYAKQPQAEWIDGVPHWTPELIAKVKRMAAELDEPKQPQAEAVPPECDVRKIMLDVVPGIDGEGHEVYAKNVADVVKLLTEMGQRIEDLEGAQQAEAPPGYAVVPVEPTEAMHRAAVKTIQRCTGNADFPPAVWRAMIAAAQGEKP